ncbi:MAG: hypothetical protein KIT00_00350 [Rhodospirillales bacterium]|nr:hypothetical protein [Rhodospirillales bacterium]
MTADLVLNPLLPWPVIAVAMMVALLLLLVLIIRRGRGWTLRLLGLAILVTAILNPSVLRERRVPQPDLALVFVDESPSQRIGDRPQQIEAIVTSLEQGISRFGDVETRTVRVHADGNRGEDGTHLFKAIKTALADETKERLAATIVISDGQVHDVPADGGEAPSDGPLHVVLTGKPDETDRRLVVDSAPAYGLVGSTARIQYRILDGRSDGKVAGTASAAMLNVRVDGRETTKNRVRVGQPQTQDIVLQHAGPTILELEAEALPGELSAINNRALVAINGVRDRLNVLLVSGQPHVGERIWRNMLKSDPAVDLVHFTILRSPDKQDLATIDELSLIAFPVRELFEERLYDFDLVIFDRYLLRGVLPFRYLGEVVTYVQKGGARCSRSVPVRRPHELFHSPMGTVLPAAPTGRVIEQAYRRSHPHRDRPPPPVTSALPGECPWARPKATQSDNDDPRVGTMVPPNRSRVRSGSGAVRRRRRSPLLVVDRVGRADRPTDVTCGSGHAARGGGGPHAELIRRLVHWLMKEPELEEERLTAVIDDDRLLIERRSLNNATTEVTVTTPSGVQKRVPVEQGDDGIGRAEVPAEEAGLYRIDDGTRTALAAGGRVNHGEFADLTATEARLRPVVDGSGGGLFWAANGIPDIRRVKPGWRAAGDDWIGLRRNDHFTVTGQNEAPVIPPLLLLALALAAFAGAWWRESH